MRRIPLALLLVGVFSAGFPVACGGGDDDPPPSTTTKPKKNTPTTTPPETLEDFSNLYPSAYCAASASCCKDKGLNGDQTACEKALTAQLLLVKDSSTFDKTQGQACISKLQALAGKSTACATLDTGVDECLKAITVTSSGPTKTKPGESCASSDECEPPADGEVRCEEIGLEGKKICQQILEGKESTTPCIGDTRQTLVVNEDPKLFVGTVYRCAAGLRCDAESRVCIPGVAVGGDCLASFDCTKDAYCSGSKCVAAVADGASCAEDEECLTARFCSSKKQCTAFLTPGSACTGDADSRCLDGACVNGKCSGEVANSTQLFCP